MIWSGPVRSGPVRSGPVRSGPVRSGLVWSGLVWSGLVWSGLVWFGLVWFGLIVVGRCWCCCVAFYYSPSERLPKCSQRLSKGAVDRRRAPMSRQQWRQKGGSPTETQRGATGAPRSSTRAPQRGGMKHCKKLRLCCGTSGVDT